MKVLFVSRSGKHFEVLPFVKSQYESLKSSGIIIDHYVIKKGGGLGYTRAWLDLLKVRKKYDIIHAHFSYCFFPVFLCFPRSKRIVSLLGSDLYGASGSGCFKRYINRLASKKAAMLSDFVIVKSKQMKEMLSSKQQVKTDVIPNGVDLKKFKDITKEEALKKIGLPDKNYLLFLGDTQNFGKNYKFVVDMEKEISEMGFEVLAPYPVLHELVPYYICAATALVFPSLQEGSPNVIKETVACGRPFLSSNVGDVSELVNYSSASSIFSSSSEFLAGLKKVLENKSYTSGQFYQRYSTDVITEKIVKLYQEVMLSKRKS